MLIFRFLCAVLMAWAINVALARPEAAALAEEAQEFLFLGPLSAGFVGFFNLAKRQGWGVIVAVANGVWAGILTLIVAVALYVMVIEVLGNYRAIAEYDDFARLFSGAAEPVLEVLLDVPLLSVVIVTTAVVGVLTEILHWCLVRLLRNKLRPENRS